MTKPAGAPATGAASSSAKAEAGKSITKPSKPTTKSTAKASASKKTPLQHDSSTPPTIKSSKLAAVTPDAAPLPEIYAAGAVVLREGEHGREVLMVHRPAFRDWTLPKGKLDPGELLPSTAVREVWEETGVRIRVGRSVAMLRYPIPKGLKVVYWWLGYVLSEQPRKPNQEVDQVAWVGIDDAAAKLTYPDEYEVLQEALRLDAGASMLIVRHGKAQSRKSFKGKIDAERPLAAKGERQSAALVNLLRAYGVGELVSSSSTRCVQTLEPYSHATGVPLRRVDLLSEEGAEIHPRQVHAYMGRLRVHAASKPEKPIAVCGHRPVLPDMFAGLGVESTPMEPAEVVVVHLDSAGFPGAIEVIPPLPDAD